MNRTIVIIDWTKPVMPPLRSASSRTTRGRPHRGRPAPRDPARRSRRDRIDRRPPRGGRGIPVKPSVPSRNRATATSSAAISAAEARGPRRPASRAIRRAGNRVGIGRPEVESRGREQVGRRSRRGQAAGIGQRVLDRQSHVRGAQLGLQGAVPEPDGRVNDALRVDDDLDGVVADIVQPVRLDDLQALVGERRGVDRDLRPHRPGRMLERLLGRHRGQLCRRGVEERAARGREDEGGDVVHGFADQALPDGRMLRVDRAQPGERARVRVGLVRGGPGGGQRARQRHHEVAAGDERLLVGRGHDLPCAQCREHRAQADDPARADDDEVDVVACRERLEGVRATDALRAGRQVQAGYRRPVSERDGRRTQPGGLLGEERAIRTGRERDDPERLRVAREDIHSLAADRTGGADQGDAARLDRWAVPAVSRRRRRHTGWRPGRRRGRSRCDPACPHGPG